MEQEIGIGKKEIGSSKRAYITGTLMVLLTLALVFAIIYYGNWIRDEMKGFGYVGAFLISILGGATVITPVPMQPVVFALGGVMRYPWLVGISAAMGEVIGAVIIYLTGYHGGGSLHNSRNGKIQAVYNKLMSFMQRYGSLTLLVLSSIVNPFFYPAALTAGAMRFGIKRYFVIVFFGKIIKAMTVVYAGYWGLKGLFRIIGINL